MAYLSSGSIKVYPSGYRDAYVDLNASRTSEESITRAVRAPLSKGSFVKLESDNSLTIVIGGYVFNVPDGVSAIGSLFPSPSQGDKVYASINIKDIDAQGASTTMKMLVSKATDDSELDDDVDGKFKGISFDSASSAGGLLVLERGASSWAIPSESKLIFDSEQITDNGSRSIAEQFSTIDLDVENAVHTGDLRIKNIENAGSLVIDDNGDVSAKDCSYKYTRTPDSGNNVHVIGGISVDSDGGISVTDTTLPKATSTLAGVVSTTTQTFSGSKTFQGNVTVGSTSFRSNLTVWGYPTFYSRATLSDGLAVGNGNIEYAYLEDQEGDTGLITKLDSDSNPVTKYNAQSATGLPGISHMYTTIKPYSLEIGYTYDAQGGEPARSIRTEITPSSIVVGDTDKRWSEYTYNIDGVSKYALSTLRSKYLSNTNVGNEGTPIYLDDQGAPVAMTNTIGSSTKPVYMNNGTITPMSSTIGSSGRPVYVSNGTITPISKSTSQDKTMYLHNGTLTEGNWVRSNHGIINQASTGDFSDAIHYGHAIFSGTAKDLGWDVVGTAVGNVVTIGLHTTYSSTSSDAWYSIKLKSLIKGLFGFSNIEITNTTSRVIATSSVVYTDLDGYNHVNNMTSYAFVGTGNVPGVTVGRDDAIAGAEGFSVFIIAYCSTLS